VSLEVVAGALPVGLWGSLYRNGPGRLQRGGQSVGHWFDGDGAILGLHFRHGEARGVYRYVQTAGYQQETKAGRYLLPGYGMVAPGPWWQRFFKDVKNVANTSVLALPDRLLTLWEAGVPHALNLETLDTMGLETGLDGQVGLQGQPYSAHPKRDPKTGDIFNFGVSMGAKNTLYLYRSDRTGQIRQQAEIALSSMCLIHDWVLAGNYLVFCIPPIQFNLLPVLARILSPSEGMIWKPELGTGILIIDRDSLQVVSRIQTDPWYQWHFGNGYELLDGSLVIDIVRYEDFQTNQRLKEIASGHLQTRADGTLWQLRLNPQAGQVLEMHQRVDRSCDFPTLRPQDIGQPSRYTYLAIHRQTTNTLTEIFDAIACFDHQTNTLTEADLGAHCYPSEPIYVPDHQNPEQGWILTVVYDGCHHASEVWIFDSDRLNDAPICRLALPGIVPHSFHGTWKPDA
jgi:carotenoid cleavage dioxygenase-like enzyme